MKINRLLLILFFLSSLYIYGYEKNVHQTGKLLFLQPDEFCTVYIDGTETGTTPLLLTLKPENKILELRGKNTIFRTELIFNKNISDITYLTPVMEINYGYLHIKNSLNSEDKLYIDDKEVTLEKNQPFKLKWGKKRIRLERKGFFPEESTVEIPLLETAVYEFTLKKSLNVFIKTELPKETEITFTNRNREYKYTAFDNIKLYPGKWTAHFNSFETEPLTIDFILKEDSVELFPLFIYYRPFLQFTGIQPQSTVLINNEDVTMELSEFKVELSPGTHEITVFKENYLPITALLTTEGNEIINMDLNYVFDPAYENSQEFSFGLKLAGIGATLLTTALILNHDDVTMNLTNSYDSYKTMKYLSLGAAGLGLTITLTGSTLSLISWDNTTKGDK